MCIFCSNLIVLPSLSLPITVCWNLTVHSSEIPLNNQSSDKPSPQPILPPYRYRCNSTNNCTTFNSNYQFTFNCTFNSTGDYQLMAMFNNSASAGRVLYNFSVSERKQCIIISCITTSSYYMYPSLYTYYVIDLFVLSPEEFNY